MNNEFFNKTNSSWTILHSSPKKNRFSLSKSPNRTNIAYERKTQAFEWKYLKALETNDSTVKSVFFQYGESIYPCGHQEYSIMRLYDGLKSFESAFLDVELELIKISKILEEKDAAIAILLKIVPNFSYRLSTEARGPFVRSTSPSKKQTQTEHSRKANTTQISSNTTSTGRLITFGNNKEIIKDAVIIDFEKNFLQKYLNFLRYLKLIEIRIIKHNHQIISTQQQKILHRKLRERFIKLKRKQLTIRSLRIEKSSLKRIVEEREEQEKVPLLIHFDQLYKLESSFAPRRAELINKIEKYKIVLQLRPSFDPFRKQC